MIEVSPEHDCRMRAEPKTCPKVEQEMEACKEVFVVNENSVCNVWLGHFNNHVTNVHLWRSPWCSSDRGTATCYHGRPYQYVAIAQ